MYNSYKCPKIYKHKFVHIINAVIYAIFILPFFAFCLPFSFPYAHKYHFTPSPNPCPRNRLGLCFSMFIYRQKFHTYTVKYAYMDFFYFILQ